MDNETRNVCRILLDISIYMTKLLHYVIFYCTSSLLVVCFVRYVTDSLHDTEA